MKMPDLEYSVLALHGFEASSQPVSAFYELALSLQSNFGHKPEQAAFSAGDKVYNYVNYCDFARKIGGVDASCLTSISVASSDGYNSSEGEFSPAGFRISVASHKYALFYTPRFNVEKLIGVASRFTDALSPSYGYVYFRKARHCPPYWAMGINYNPIQNRGINAQPVERHSLGLWNCPWLQCEVFNYGFLRDVFEFNIVSDLVLTKTIEGAPLRDWIQAEHDRGSLEEFPNNLWLWRVAKSEVLPVAARLQVAGLILSEDNQEVLDLGRKAHNEFCMKYQAEEAARQAAKKRKGSRMKLIRLLRLLDERQDQRPGAVLALTLEEFFDGNSLDESIAVNLSDHPGLKKFQSELKKIRAKDTVQDVLIGIVDHPSSPENDDDEFEDDDWPYSDEVYVFTSSPPDQVAKWASKLLPDQVTFAEWREGGKPVNAPELEPGMRLVRLWWD